MKKSTLIFDKRQRRLISDLIRGINPGTAPVTDYSFKIQAILKAWDIETLRTTIHQQIWWASNVQDTFRAAYKVLESERPEQLKSLFADLQLMEVRPVLA